MTAAEIAATALVINESNARIPVNMPKMSKSHQPENRFKAKEIKIWNSDVTSNQIANRITISCSATFGKIKSELLPPLPPLRVA